MKTSTSQSFPRHAYPYRPEHTPPSEELAGKVVLDNNNYVPRRDGHFPAVASGHRTIHELRQEKLPAAKLAKVFRHIQFHGRAPARVPGDAVPALIRLARPAGALDRTALVDLLRNLKRARRLP